MFLALLLASGILPKSAGLVVPTSRSSSWSNILQTQSNTRRFEHCSCLFVTDGRNDGVSYALHWENILMIEHQETVADMKNRRRNWSKRRLEDTGMSLFHAFAEPDSDMLGEKMVRIHKPNERFLYERFTRGDVLTLTNMENPNNPRDCLVVDVGHDWMTVGVGGSWPAGLNEARRQGGVQVRLDRTAPHAPMRAQCLALNLLKRNQAGTVAMLLANLRSNDFGLAPSDNSLNIWIKQAASPPQRLAHIDPVTLRNQIDSSLQEAQAANSFQPNKSQEDAIRHGLQRSISLIQGPAGTGKSRLAALLVATALRIHSVCDVDDAPRILAVAHSNGAADVLLQALLEMKVPALRVGRPASIAANLLHRTVVSMTERHPETVRARARIRDLTLPPHERSVAAYELKQTISSVQLSLIRTAPVIVTSCIGAHQLFDANDKMTFPLVICDEAAQTTEPALLCALASARAEQVVLLGDTRQLPPTVSSVDLRKTLGVSPMARLEKAGIPKSTLNSQYRMAQALVEHPSAYFYNGLVTSASGKQNPFGAQRQAELPPNGFMWPNATLPLAFVQVGGDDLEVTHDFGGKSNPTEANIVTRIVAGILHAGSVDADQIAVISPYSKQVQQIRSKLAVHRLDSVRVGTVDSFQGQEKDVIIISCVRSNTLGELGFLRDSRRLCVAITRAKRALIVVGDKTCLGKCRHWAALIESIDERGGFVDSQGVAAQDASSRLDESDGELGISSEEEDLLEELLGNNEEEDATLAALFG